MMKKHVLLLGLIALFQCCKSTTDDSPAKEDYSMVLEEEQKKVDDNANDTGKSMIIGGEEIDLESVESGVEAAIEITQTIVEARNDMIEARRRRDSIQQSKREKMFVYQLGVSYKNEKLILEAYKNLTDKEGIYAFKKGRKEYLLVKYQDKDEEQLQSELEDYKLQYSSEVIGEIKKINLMRECSKNESPRLIGEMKSRKHKVQLKCLSCK